MNNKNKQWSKSKIFKHMDRYIDLIHLASENDAQFMPKGFFDELKDTDSNEFAKIIVDSFICLNKFKALENEIENESDSILEDIEGNYILLEHPDIEIDE